MNHMNLSGRKAALLIEIIKRECSPSSDRYRNETHACARAVVAVLATFFSATGIDDGEAEGPGPFDAEAFVKTVEGATSWCGLAPTGDSAKDLKTAQAFGAKTYLPYSDVEYRQYWQDVFGTCNVQGVFRSYELYCCDFDVSVEEWIGLAETQAWAPRHPGSRPPAWKGYRARACQELAQEERRQRRLRLSHPGGGSDFQRLLEEKLS